MATHKQKMDACGKLLQFIMGHKDAGPFLEPVQWKEWGLLDYPKVIKNMMDLGTKKLQSGQYSSPKEFKHDVNLVWNNCMTYNARLQDGSEYWNMAANLKRVFEEKFAKAIKEDDEASADSSRPPTLLDKKMFSQNIYNISAEDLGRVVQILDQRCDSCIKKIDPEDIEIDIDAIDNATFWTVDGFVKDCLPGNKKSAAMKKLGGGPAKAAPAGAEGPKAKKART